MHQLDRADSNEFFKTLSRAYEIVKYYVTKIPFEQRIAKKDLGDIQIPISLV